VLRAAHTGEVVPLTGPGRRRDWVWVGDVVDACIRAAVVELDPDGLVCNIGTGVQTPNEGVVAAAERATGRIIRTDPGAHPGRDWDSAHWVADVRRARAVLGWEPTVDLEAGLARTWQAEPAGAVA
jgi:nucleoside-diphosphate-sugar epimerase